MANNLTSAKKQKNYPAGLLGLKVGMTQIFDEQGKCIPVTVVDTGPCFVLGKKTIDKDSYEAVQLGYGYKNANKLNKPEKGFFQKIGAGAFQYIKEVRCELSSFPSKELGQEVNATEIFKEGEMVDVSGVSIGKGFAGVVKKHNMKGRPATRGTHETRRNVGSIGCRKFPGRVFKNKRMPARMGNENVTVKNLKVVKIEDSNIVLIKGAIPGARNSLVTIRRSIDLASA